MQASDVAPVLPASWTIEGLVDAGFEGFRRFDELRLHRPPSAPGVYMVIRDHTRSPGFASTNSAGRHRDFTEPVERLAEAWVDDCQVLYVGLARSGKRGDGLHRRLKQFRRTGAGRADNHSGGVSVFQLADADELRVCWRVSADPSDEGVVAEEHALIEGFVRGIGGGKRPFANRRD